MERREEMKREKEGTKRKGRREYVGEWGRRRNGEKGKGS